MDPLFFHAREIGSAKRRNRILEALAHPKKDPIGSIGFHMFFLPRGKNFRPGDEGICTPLAPVLRGGGGRTLIYLLVKSRPCCDILSAPHPIYVA